MRSAVLGGVLCLVALHAHAFDGTEHKRLSMAALEAARKLAPPSLAMARAIDEWPAEMPNFGDLTLAVDWFANANDLANADPKNLRHVINVHHWNPFAHGFAMHNNETHFQDGALRSWQEYHQQAIEQAHDQPVKALLNEAVALHYLQDFFSVGHLVTPRHGMHDAVAGHLHDRFNRDGVSFKFEKAIDTSIEDVLGKFTDDTAPFRKAVNDGKSLFHGDGALSCPACGAQYTFVELVSTLSVAQVLAASTGKSRLGLQPCFTLRSAVRSAKYEGQFEDFKGPDGGIAIETNETRTVPSPVKCAGASWLGHYDTVEDARLTGNYYKVLGATSRVEIASARHSRGLRLNADLLFFILAYDPPDGLSVRPNDERAGSKWLSLRMGGVGPSYSQGKGYHALGLLYDYYQASPIRQLSWGFRFAPRRYTYSGTHHWKWDYGVKTTLGLDVFSIGLAVERARHIDALGRFRPTYFVSLGTEISLSSSWARKIIPRRNRCPTPN